MRTLAPILVLVPGLALADQPISVESLELDDLLDLQVAAATKVSQPLSETPAIGAVFRRDQLEDFGWLTLNDVLYTQPGFFPSQDYERRTVGARGEHEDWNNNRLLLLIDGMPQNDIECGTAFTAEQTPLFLAQRLEILRGAGSALYGSYALNGVIAIDTPTAAEIAADGARVRTIVGHDGTTMLDVLTGQQSRWGDLVLAFNRFTTPGDDFRDADLSLATLPVKDKHSSTYFFLKADGKGALAGLSLSFQAQSWLADTYRGWFYYMPDRDEDMNESRQILALRYRPRSTDGWRQELAIQLQRHGYDEELRLYPAGSLDGYYPNGVSERIETALYSGFVRAQATRLLPDGASLLAGAEYTVLGYRGDDVHQANVDLTDGRDAPPVDGVLDLPSIYQPLEGHLVHKLGVFGQLATGRLLGDNLELTVGLRFDDLFFGYTAVDVEGSPERSRSFEDISPRAALVWRPERDLGVKLMVARAFRTPTPVELFSSNTWTSSPADPATMRGERQDSAELAADWRVLPGFRIRANGFVAHLADEIGYNADDTEIINRYSDTRVGFESELLADLPLPGALQLDGWLSYSFVAVVDQTTHDPNLTLGGDVFRAPTQLVKAGLRLRQGRFALALQAMGQGEEKRAISDLATAAYRAFRPDVVPAWIVVGAAARLRATDWLRLGLTVENLFDSAGRMAAPRDLPFDDHVPARRVLFEIELGL